MLGLEHVIEGGGLALLFVSQCLPVLPFLNCLRRCVEDALILGTASLQELKVLFLIAALQSDVSKLDELTRKGS